MNSFDNWEYQKNRIGFMTIYNVVQYRKDHDLCPGASAVLVNGIPVLITEVNGEYYVGVDCDGEEYTFTSNQVRTSRSCAHPVDIDVNKMKINIPVY